MRWHYHSRGMKLALKSVVDTIESVPEALREHYEARDGKFHLAAEGLVPKARVDEFRDTNIATRRELDALKAQFYGVDPELYKTLTAKEAEQREKKLIDAGKVEEMFAERTAAMKAEHERAVKGLSDTATATTRRLESLLVDGALKDAAIKAGVAPTGVEDVVLRGRQVFRLHEGNATAFDGDKPIYGKSGEALSMTEWLAGLSERAPHLFIASQGTGAVGSRGTGNAKSMTRGEFDKLAPADKATAAKTMTITD